MRDWIKAIPLGIWLPVALWLTTVKPEDVGSNISAWLKWAGASDLPSWITAKSADHWTAAVSIALAVVYALLAWRALVRRTVEKVIHHHSATVTLPGVQAKGVAHGVEASRAAARPPLLEADQGAQIDVSGGEIPADFGYPFAKASGERSSINAAGVKVTRVDSQTMRVQPGPRGISIGAPDSDFEFTSLRDAARLAFEGVEDRPLGEYLAAMKNETDIVSFMVSAFQVYGRLWGCVPPSSSLRTLDKERVKHLMWEVGTDAFREPGSKYLTYVGVSVRNNDLAQLICTMKDWTLRDLNKGRH